MHQDSLLLDAYVCKFFYVRCLRACVVVCFFVLFVPPTVRLQKKCRFCLLIYIKNITFASVFHILYNNVGHHKRANINRTFMDGNVNSNDNLATANNDAGDAVGVSQPFRWYVAIVSNNTEKVCAEKIAALGYDTYVPTQKELRRWKNGRRKIIDRIVIPAAVFVRCTEADRRHHVVNLPFVKRFMVNRAAATNQYGWHPVAIVPDREIEKLRFILYNSDAAITIEPLPLRLGDKVRVVRGKLLGLEGNIVRCESHDSADAANLDIVVQLDILGCARMNISPTDLEKIGK